MLDLDLDLAQARRAAKLAQLARVRAPTQFGGPRAPRACARTAKSTGRRCRLPAVTGTSCCRVHGGAVGRPRRAPSPELRARREARRLLRAGLVPRELAQQLDVLRDVVSTSRARSLAAALVAARVAAAAASGDAEVLARALAQARAR